MKTCTFENCKYKTVGKRYDYCIKHMNNQKPISNASKPDECPICLCGEEEENLVQYCCGHHIHRQCIIYSGKTKCPICRQFIYLDKQTLKELRTLAKQKQLETQDPLLIVFEIQLENPKPLSVKYGMNTLYKHDTKTIDKTIAILRKYIVNYMHDLDGALLTTCISKTLSHRMEQVHVIRNAIQQYHKDIIVDMMKLIVNDVKKDDDTIYFPTGVDTHIEYSGVVKHSLTFYCKIKYTHRQENTPDFGYIEW